MKFIYCNLYSEQLLNLLSEFGTICDRRIQRYQGMRNCNSRGKLVVATIFTEDHFMYLRRTMKFFYRNHTTILESPISFCIKYHIFAIFRLLRSFKPSNFEIMNQASHSDKLRLS